MKNNLLKKRIISIFIDSLISFPIFILFKGISSIPIVGLSLFIAYFYLLNMSSLQGTFGDYLTKIKVVSFENNNRIDARQSMLRIIGILLTIISLGYLNRKYWKENLWYHDYFSKSKFVLRK